MRRMRVLRTLAVLLLLSPLILIHRVGEGAAERNRFNLGDRFIMNISRHENEHGTVVSRQIDEEELFFNKPKSTPEQSLIKVYKKKRVLELYGDGRLLGRFKVALGGSPEGDKNREGDLKTPIGNYYICTRNNKSRFFLFMGVSYPNVEDGARGFESGLIDRSTYEFIKEAERSKTVPPWNTPLGGEVGIHGGGNEHDWTLGCIALSDEDIKLVWQYTSKGTPVEIYE